jgi:hypothetical protein
VRLIVGCVLYNSTFTKIAKSSVLYSGACYTRVRVIFAKIRYNTVLILLSTALYSSSFAEWDVSKVKSSKGRRPDPRAGRPLVRRSSPFLGLEPAMDESQGPGHGASASQDLPFTSQLMPVPNYTAW